MMKKRITFAVTILLTALLGVAYAAQFIYLGGPLGDQGTFPVLGGTKAAFHSDADHVLTAAEYAGGQITLYNVTSSLSVPRAALLPAIAGEAKDIYNNTSGGQAVLIGAVGPDGGVYGITVSVANGALARVVTPDGINYYAIAGGASIPAGAGVVLSDGGAEYTAAATPDGGFLRANGTAWSSQYIQSTDLPAISLASGVTGTLPHGNGGTDITSPGTAGKYLRSDGTNWTSASLAAGDVTGTLAIANGGTGITASGADGGFLRSNGSVWSSQYIQTTDVPYYPTFTTDDFDSGTTKATLSLYAEICVPFGNMTVCSIPLAGWTGDATTWVTVGQIKPAVSTGTLYNVSFYAFDKGQDAGGAPGNEAKCNLEFGLTDTAAGVINMVAAAGSAGPSTVSIPLACISAFAMGSTDAGPDAGVASQATGFTFQALNTSGVIAFQVKGPDTHYWQIGGAIQRAVLQ